jgi:GLPGLI family protein
MYLQIGNEISKYMSFINFQTDSLISDDIRKGNNINLLEAIKNGRYQMGSDHILLFKNFPKYKNTVGNRIVYDSYIYEEDIVTPKWKIEKEQVTILGYSCTKATTRFCGRNYTVWFSPDIPVSEGPWKFTGLPGLILRVHDDKGEVTFECTQIQNVGWSDPILKSVSNPQTIKTTKKKFYDQLKKYCDNPSGFIENNTRVTSTAPKRILPKKMYNPIELFE